MRQTIITSVLCCALGLACTQALAVPLVGVSFSGGSGAVICDISPQTGQASNVRPLGINNLVGAAATPQGKLYGLTNGTQSTGPASLYVINPATGSTTLVGSTGLFSVAEGDLAIDPMTGVLYGGYYNANNHRQLFTINPTNGQATLLSGECNGDSSAMAFDSTGNLFVVDNSLGKLYHVNKTTGAVTSTVSLSRSLGAWVGMAIDPATGMFYVADGGSGATGLFYTLDPNTGVLTTVGPTGLTQGFSGLAFLPEPATLVLFAGLAAFSIRRRR